jgi:hypothetical protein
MEEVPIKSNSEDDFINKISSLNIMIYVANSNIFCEKEGIESIGLVEEN